MVSEFGRVCEKKKLRVNVGKSKVMVVTTELLIIKALVSSIWAKVVCWNIMSVLSDLT